MCAMFVDIREDVDAAIRLRLIAALGSITPHSAAIFLLREYLAVPVAL